MDKFKWGIIGPGRIAEQFAEDVLIAENSELVAVASRSGADEFANKYNVPTTYDSYEALAVDENIDGVYIATPHRFHFENARLCLEAGKPVLCEKPLSVNSTQVQKLIEIALENDVFLMEALWSRFLPAYQQIRIWLEDGEIGEVLMVRSEFCIHVSKSEDERWLNPNLAGGTLLDLGVYPIAISQYILKENPERLQALAVLGKTGVDVRLAVNLEYPSGVISQFATSFDFQMDNGLVIVGDKGKILIPKLFWAAESVILDIKGRQTQVDLHFRGRGFEYEIEEAVRSIRAGKIESPIMSHQDSLNSIKVMDEIREEIGLKYPFE